MTHPVQQRLFHTFVIDVNCITSFNFAKILFVIVLTSNPKTMKFENPNPET